MIRLEGELDDIGGLRDEITAIYEDARGLFARLRDEDLSRSTAEGRPLWMAAAAMIECAGIDARTGRRMAGGASAARSWPIRVVEALAGRLRTRRYAHAGRRAMLSAWENRFNELFSSINDAGEEPIGDEASDTQAARQLALAYLSGSVARLRQHLAAFRQALEPASQP